MAKHQTSVTILSGGLYGEHQTSVTVVGNTVMAEPLDRYDNCRWKRTITERWNSTTTEDGGNLRPDNRCKIYRSFVAQK